MNSLSKVIEFNAKCKKCGDIKSLNDFHVSKNTSNNREGTCKKCRDMKRIVKEILPDSHLDIVNGKRTCNLCKIEKSLVNFVKNKFGTLGRSYRCKSCDNTRKRTYKGKQRENQFYKRRYGLSFDDVRGMLNKQMSLCANRACGKEITLETKGMKGNKAVVDHSHDTGKVRGLLCTACNTALGFLENKNRTLGLTEYLQRTMS